MFHLNDRTLERLVTGSASTIEVDRIRRHVDECRACSRRLEEWRDNFSEVDQHFPSLAQNAAPITAATPGGIVLVPPAEERRRVFLDLANILWGVAVVLAVIVGYGLSRLGNVESPRDRVGGFSYLGAADSGPGGLGAPLPPRPAVGARETVPDAAPPPRESTVTPPQRPALDPAPAPAASEPPPLPVSRGFAKVQRADAARRLQGAVRGVAGLEPEHYEVGPPTAVAGAQKNIDVVRVVYRVGDGGRLTLDQQLIPMDASGFRPIDDPALESGETVYRSGPNGTNTAVWLDESGYRLALSARVSQDSLRRLVARVQ